MSGLGLVVTGCGTIVPSGFAERMARRLSPHQARRLDHLSRMLLVVAFDALEQAGLERGAGERAAVVVGTGLGCLEKTDDLMGGVARLGAAHADALTFPDSVDNAPAAHVAIALGFRGPTLTVSQREISGECAVLLAALLLRRGMADVVVVAAGDTTSPRLGAALARLVPGRAPGAAAAAIILETAAVAAGRGAAPRARLLAATQASGPVPGARSRTAPAAILARAEAEALAQAGVAAGDLAVPHRAAASRGAQASRAQAPFILADGVVRAVEAIARLQDGAPAPCLVSRAARGGLAAALLFGPAPEQRR